MVDSLYLSDSVSAAKYVLITVTRPERRDSRSCLIASLDMSSGSSVLLLERFRMIRFSVFFVITDCRFRVCSEDVSLTIFVRSATSLLEKNFCAKICVFSALSSVVTS